MIGIMKGRTQYNFYGSRNQGHTSQAWVNSEYSSKKSLSCFAGFFEKSYFADEQKHRFLGKFAKLLEKGVKC